MEATTSASPVTPVRPDQAEQFGVDGAVLLRGVIQQEWIELLAEGLDECYEQPDGMSSTLDAGTGGEIRIDQFPAARSEKLQRFIAESPVASLVGAMVEGPVRFYMDQMFYKPAGGVMATAWHQDTSYYNVAGSDLIRAWVSPDSVPRHTSLEVVRGSHRWNVTYRTLAGRRRESDAPPSTVERAGTDFSYGDAISDTSLPRLPDVEGNRASFDIMGWDYEPGDVILFHGDMLHSARGNVTLDQRRRAHAAMFAGPEVHYLHRLGQVIPDPVGLAKHNPQDGQPLADFPDTFPLVWQPN